MDNMKIWDSLKRPPETALKKITGGRLGGMTDIKPQWRYEAMTEQFGPVGIGWRYKIDNLWIEEGADGVQVANAVVLLYVKDGEWSDGIPGVGGSTLVAKEKNGLYTSDEAYKMAVTDALGNAMKYLGVAADIYAGHFDGSKYVTPATNHRFKPGEKEEIHKQVRDCLENGDDEGLKQIFSEYADADEKLKVWSIFDSTERAAIKELMK